MRMPTPGLAMLTRAAVAAALTATLAQVSIPLPFTPVPVTLQVLGVLLSGIVLTPAAAALSQAVYVALGAAGLPVFAGFAGGARHLVGPTGGYLWGFVVAAPLTSLIYRRLRRPGRRLSATGSAAVACAAGIGAIYALGVAQLGTVLDLPWQRAVAMGAAPFIAVDLAKAAAAAVVGPSVERAVREEARAPAASPQAPARPA